KSYIAHSPNDVLPQIEENRREEFLLTLMLQRPDTIPVVDKAEAVDDFSDPNLKALASIIIKAFRRTKAMDLRSCLDDVEEEQKNFVTGLSIREEDFGDINSSLKDCICQIKRNRIKKMQVYLTQKIKKAQAERSESEIINLNKQKIELSIQEKNLNSNIGSLLNL
ncbi:MAG: hypothetical protein J7M06_05360, partial [Proteobacteria bacterium]|nr:hypothetical protein [Pseudomonadota bacterium]